ncbi:hypothetical protein DYB28_014615, partial [Aphanomyces astaci]
MAGDGNFLSNEANVPLGFVVAFFVLGLLPFCCMRLVCSKPRVDDDDDPLLPNEEVGQLAGLTRDKLEDTYRSQWTRRCHGSTWTWQCFPLADPCEYMVLSAASEGDVPYLVELAAATAGQTVLGHGLPSWWSRPLSELQALPFSLKYAWLLSYLAVEYHAAHAKLTLTRATIFDQSMHALNTAHVDQLCLLTIISLVGESAVDAGGVTREWYTLLTMAIVDESRGLFV